MLIRQKMTKKELLLALTRHKDFGDLLRQLWLVTYIQGIDASKCTSSKHCCVITTKMFSESRS